MKRLTFLLLAAIAVLLASCKPDDPIVPINPNNPGDTLDVTDTIPEGILTKGVFVLNEGTYTFANASLAFYDPEADTVGKRLFYKANGAPIGDVAQSLALINDDLFIVVNNSNYIYKVNAHTLKCDLTQNFKLDNFYSPRFMLPLSPNKAYVTDLMGNEIWIINPQQMTHTGTIAMGKPTETMVKVGSEVYVTNWSNYYNNSVENNTVMVVSAENDIKVAEIQVGKEPNGMVVDKNGYVWVLCEGAYWDIDAEDPSLWKINPLTKTATCERTFYYTAMNLAIDPTGTYLYYFDNGDVRRMSVDDPTAEDSFLIPSDGRTLYKIAVNPNNGDIYVTDAKNYMVNGSVYRYSSDGLLLSDFSAGICPSFMLFN